MSESVYSGMCGCKGIRTCLICESQKYTLKTKQEIKDIITYVYCPYCNLCWPKDCENKSPFFLQGMAVIPDFVNDAEEKELVEGIDQIPWMPSQSGRKKQDFGPKVNFKKKKGKVGCFKGFPQFSEKIVKRLQLLDLLSDFKPVEMCNLEYTLERGSAIEPHMDDTWIWGDRLVTINLISTTILTLTPATPHNCHCNNQLQDESRNALNWNLSNKDVKNEVNHSSIDNLKNGQKEFARSDNVGGIKKACCTHLQKCAICSCKENINSSVNFVKVDEISRKPVNEYGGVCENDKCSEINTKCLYDSKVPCTLENMSCGGVHNVLLPQKKCSEYESTNLNCDVHNGKLKTMCSVYRTKSLQDEVNVQVNLPPKSLVVLYGCARNNWYHEIKRQHVISRRLAMTFRELAPDFLEGGSECQLGSELLEISGRFCNFNLET